VNSTLQENEINDFFIQTSDAADCDHIIQNNTGSGGRAIEYYNYSVNIEDKTLSLLVLCDADNSNITNVTLIGSDTYRNNGFGAIGSDYLNITGLNSTHNSFGISLYYNNFTTLSDSVLNDNLNQGLIFTGVRNSSVDNATIQNNLLAGIIFNTNSEHNIVNNSILIRVRLPFTTTSYPGESVMLTFSQIVVSSITQFCPDSGFVPEQKARVVQLARGSESFSVPMILH